MVRVRGCGVIIVVRGQAAQDKETDNKGAREADSEVRAQNRSQPPLLKKPDQSPNCTHRHPSY